VSHNTARAWLSILETSFIIHRLPAWHANIRKQVVKAPKIHFFDSGLVCYLLGIRESGQLRHHPLRGAIFESWVVSELYKAQLNRGEEPNMFHYRESRGVEIDLLVNRGDILHAIEIKSGATVTSDAFRNFRHMDKRLRNTSLPDEITYQIIFGGEQSQKRTGIELLSWRNMLKGWA